MKPIVYLLCGLGGSGKSTYARELAKNGLQKFSLDEYVYSLHGRAITSLPEQVYLQHYRTAKLELDKELINVIKKKQSVVLDYGFWRRGSRDYYKKLIDDNGGEWKLIYLKASPEILMRRLKERNKRTDANAFPVSEEMLSGYIERFEEPKNEGEEIIQQS
ncbi:MAG TPA: ATP-binding protein [Candidatus Dormibacteraeota bacterium]|nr:ATP-binding protein [Candidatus Dormibacteraeota bacterium]